MSSLGEYFLYCLVKFFGFLIRLLPAQVALALGRLIGTAAYHLDVKHRYQVYINLKIAFSGTKSLAEIKQISRQAFEHFGQNFIELLRLPLMNPQVYKKYVHIEGQENIDEALKQGKGVILLAMHYGSWEMSNLAPAMMGYPYKVIVKPQKRFPLLDNLLNSYRQGHGSLTIARGMGVREFVRTLQNNEAVGLVLDQGGRDGVLVPFFDRNASMSVGAIRMGLKLGVPICLSVITREKGPNHRIVVHKALELERTGDAAEDIRRNVHKVTKLMEQYVRQHPEQYMWFYKIWKYSNHSLIAILNDGRTGHLRQSQTVAKMLEKVLKEKGVITQTRTWEISYRNSWAARAVSLISVFANTFFCQSRLGFLSGFLSKESFDQMMSVKADFVISCGSKAAAVNYLLANEQQAKNISILKPGLLSFNRFDSVVVPQHDAPRRKIRTRSKVIETQGAPNLISPEYLTEQADGLLRRFSHLKVRDKLTLGLLIGGDTKHFLLGEHKVRMVVHQMLEAAEALDAEILVTTSRRTSVRVENMLQREIKRSRRCELLILANRANVPEAVGGILGFSDIVVVSGDSISMISEAASSGKKTVVFPLQNLFNFSPEKYKHDRFIDLLHTQGFVLSSDPQQIRQAIYNLAKNKIQLKTLQDQQLIYEGLKQIV